MQLPPQQTWVFQVPFLFPASGNGCTQQTFLQWPGYVAVLQGFDVRFGAFSFIGFDDDHKLKHLRVRVTEGLVSVCLEDNNGDDQYAFNVFVSLVPECFVDSVGTTGVKRSNGGGGSDEYTVVPGTVPVLSGFEFEFSDGDHEIRYISVEVDNRIADEFDRNLVQVSFGDRNDDDDYDWQVWYARISEDL